MPPNREPQVETSPLRLRHHYFYIIFWILLASLLLYLPGGLSYIDALLLASGAATQSGLNPVDLNRLHLLQQITLWIVPMATNVVFMHSLLVLIRLYWFRRRFRRAIRDAKALCHAERGRWNQHLLDSESPTLVGLTRTVPEPEPRTSQESAVLSEPEDQERHLLTSSPESKPANGSSGPHITFDDTDRDYELKKNRRHTYSSYPVNGNRRASISSTRTRNSHDIYGSTMPNLPPLMWQSSIASYSQWNEAQKEELGGIEYRALKTLMVILVSYFLVFHIVGMLVFMLWISLSPQYDSTLAEIKVNKFWWATFTSGSAFNDLGYTLSPDSMASFRYASFPLLTMAFLIVMGNTGFPCMLRLIIWALSKMTSYGTPFDEELHYLLEHPRRCFTLLFPRADTWRLAAVLLLLNAIDLVIFYALQEVSTLTGRRECKPRLTLSEHVGRTVRSRHVRGREIRQRPVPNRLDPHCGLHHHLAEQAPSSDTSLLPGDDVHLGLSYRHRYAQDERVRGKEPGDLLRRHADAARATGADVAYPAPTGVRSVVRNAGLLSHCCCRGQAATGASQ